jgi:hypothetical protein
MYFGLCDDPTSAIRKCCNGSRPFRFLCLGLKKIGDAPSYVWLMVAFCGVLKSHQKCHQIAPLIRSLEFEKNGKGSFEQRDPLRSTALRFALCQYMRYLIPERPAIPSKGLKDSTRIGTCSPQFIRLVGTADHE